MSETHFPRRTFAIISHPDAGKTTLTEKLLWFGGAIQVAGEVRARKARRFATSDWMAMEKERGISVTSSVMQFSYREHRVNLLDTPGHEDFSEDTYRTLTAVDSAVMVIDSVNGVEAQTIKLLNVCRLRATPILTFINKLDREGKPPVELLDEIESILKMACAPITWPLGMGKNFKGVYDLQNDCAHLFSKNEQIEKTIQGIQSAEFRNLMGQDYDNFVLEIELLKGAGEPFDLNRYLKGEQTPVFFGSAVNNFGVQDLLNALIDYAPSPLPRLAKTREVLPNEAEFSGFVFKIQANMDPKHRDRMAFLRVCSGHFQRGMKIKQVKTGKFLNINNAITFMAEDRKTTDEAFPGDILGIPNHGNISLGETFTQNENLEFVGIPRFAPEIFKRAQIKNPLKIKQLQKGLQQLAEEGAAQLFRPLSSNDYIIGALGQLQFDVVAHRLKYEYGVDLIFEPYAAKMARWIKGNANDIAQIKNRHIAHLAQDSADCLVYLAPNNAYLLMMMEKFPQLQFLETQEMI